MIRPLVQLLAVTLALTFYFRPTPQPNAKIEQEKAIEAQCARLSFVTGAYDEFQAIAQIQNDVHDSLRSGLCVEMNYKGKLINNACRDYYPLAKTCESGAFSLSIHKMPVSNGESEFWTILLAVGIFTLLTYFVVGLLTSRLAIVAIDMALQKIAGDEKLVADTDRLFDRTCRRISKILGFNYWLEDGIDSAHSKLAKINSILDKASAEKVSGEIQNRERDRFLETIRVLRHDLTGTTAPLQAAIGLIDSKSDAFGLIATSIRKIGLSIDKLYRFDDRKKQERIGVAEVYLEEAISKAKAEMRDTKGAKLVLSYDPSELSGIRVDEHEFQSVLDAFLDNARVAVPDTDGVVKVSVERINNTAIITIEDNGPGVPKEFIPRLMKYGQTTGTKGELGVGLYNANEKVKSWGGVVTYEPANPGARFKILLPLAEKGMFIGLVDGEKYRVIDDLDHTVKALTEGGFEVLDSASTFYEGLDLMKRAPDDGSVILVDNRLDDDHLGTDLIKLQRRREKVYLCTNDYDDSVVIDRARALGVKILPKPLCTHAPFG